MSTNSISVKVNVNVSLQAFGIQAGQISPQVAQTAADLLGAFKFPTTFGGTEASALVGTATAQSQFAALAEKPAGYGQTAVAGAYAQFTAGFNMSVDIQQHHHHHHHHDWSMHGMGGMVGLLGALNLLETADRVATMQLRDMVGQVGVAAKDLAGMLAPQKPNEVDKFATGQTCRTGKHNPSNMTNADHITLAIYDILKTNQDKGVNAAGRPGGMSHEELAKQLEAKYGIKAEVTTVTSKEGDKLKALKFEGGQVFADGAGDGQADLGDYDFKGAVADITARTGMTKESFAAGAVEFKAGQVDLKNLRKELDGFLKEAGELYKKLGDDFQKRWGEPLDIGQPSLPPWLTNLLGDKKAGDADPPKATDSRELFRQSLSDIYGLFALGFAFSDPTRDTQKKKPTSLV